MKFRKKPIVIDAVQWLGPDDETDLETWGQFAGAAIDQVSDSVLMIETLEGRMKAEIGDWIIRGIKGEFYPCKPDIFEATYESVDAECAP